MKLSKSGNNATIAGLIAGLILVMVLACFLYSKQNYGHLQSAGNDDHLTGQQRFLERPRRHI